MYNFQKIPKSKLFVEELDGCPEKLYLFTDLKYFQADIDIIIGTHNNPEAVNLTINNYLSLEKDKSLHILVVDSSQNLLNFMKIRSGRNISKILILNTIPCTNKEYESRFWASNGAAIAAQIGIYLGQAPYIFFSHSDMMGYKKNFLSFLLSKLNKNTPIASFTQRHVVPFSGGMLFDRNYFESLKVDWLPASKNFYSVSGLEKLRDRIQHLDWIDTGEKLIFAALDCGQQAYICASRGLTGDYYGHPLKQYNLTDQEVKNLGVPIHYASDILSGDRFREKYPDLAREENAMWRKCFDDDSDLIFIHRGRGTSRGRKKDNRGDFETFVNEFNQRIQANH